MGYDLHITRAENWFESEKRPIKMEEWKQYIQSEQFVKEGPRWRKKKTGLKKA